MNIAFCVSNIDRYYSVDVMYPARTSRSRFTRLTPTRGWNDNGFLIQSNSNVDDLSLALSVSTFTILLALKSVFMISP